MTAREDQQNSESPRISNGSASRRFWITVLLAVAVVGLISWGFKNLSRGEPRGGLAVGKTIPELRVAGWIDNRELEAGQWNGQVRVLHAWFPECRYCWEEAPKLRQLYEKYRQRNVQFVGLTYQGAERQSHIEQYVRENRLPWPNGYGALEMLQQMHVEYFPAVWVIDRDGRIVWNRDSLGDMETAIEAALSARG